MNQSQITIVGMDVHKKQHQIAYHHPQTGKLIEFTINNTAKDVKKMVKKTLKQAPGEVIFHYEAGCLGFELKRRIEAAGAKCKVIAPSLIPVKPGNRIKTNRRDAKDVCEYAEAGQLTEVHPPSPKQEALRDLTRLREAAQRDLVRIRHQVSKYVLRYGYAYVEGNHWTAKHMLWLQGRNFSDPLANEVFAQMLSELDHRMTRSQELSKRIEQIAKEAPYHQPVEWLCCFRGIDTITAISIIAELFGFERFDNPKDLMAYLGLVPSEHSSGDSRKMGGITKAGNGRVRRLLIQAAWHQRHKPYQGKTLKQRQKGQEQWVLDIANKCMKRLYQRYWHLVDKRGKSTQCATTAVAREFVGFIWQILYTWIAIVPEEENAPEKKSA